MARSRLRDRARALRLDSTAAERLLWRALQNRQLGGWKWRRQAPVGPFVADFLCPAARVIVELDGGQHADATAAYDARRTEWLEAQGFQVLRVWNCDVLAELDGVCDAILLACGGPSPAGPHPPIAPQWAPPSPSQARARGPRPQGVGG